MIPGSKQLFNKYSENSIYSSRMYLLLVSIVEFLMFLNKSYLNKRKNVFHHSFNRFIVFPHISIRMFISEKVIPGLTIFKINTTNTQMLVRSSTVVTRVDVLVSAKRIATLFACYLQGFRVGVDEYAVHYKCPVVLSSVYFEVLYYC